MTGRTLDALTVHDWPDWPDGEVRAAVLERRVVDPAYVLRGPIIVGAGIFLAVIAGVLASRPGPPPPALEGRLASMANRMNAALIDAAIPLVAGWLVFGWSPGRLVGSLLLMDLDGPVPWLGFAALWTFATAVGDLGAERTLGRAMMDLRLVGPDGAPLPLRRRLVRFGVRSISVAFPPLALFWLSHARSRALHDLAADAWVVQGDRSTKAGDTS